MATSKPSKQRKQPSAKIQTAAQKRQAQEQISKERTERLAHQAYLKAYRHAQVAIARREAKADAMRDAGIEPRQQQPLTKAPKASGRKPFKPAKPAQKASGKNARGKK